MPSSSTTSKVKSTKHHSTNKTPINDILQKFVIFKKNKKNQMQRILHKIIYVINNNQAIISLHYQTNRMTILIPNIHQYFSDVSLVSGEAFGIFTFKQCLDSWMSAINNIEIPGIATIKYKHTANMSNIKYQVRDEDGIKEFSKLHH